MTLARPLSAHGRGILLRICAAVCFATMSALLKAAAERGVVASELLFYRALFSLPVVLLWVLIGPGLRALGTRRPAAHAGRALLGVVSLLATLQGLTLLTLADAITIGFTAPVFATILSFLLLKEKVGVHRWGSVLAGFLGVAIVMQPTAGAATIPLDGFLFALAGALGGASVTIAISSMRGEHVAAIVFWFFVASLLLSALTLPFVGGWHDAHTLALLAGAGVSTAIAQLAMTASLRHAPVSMLMPFDYLQIIGAVLFGWFLFAQWPTLSTLAGGALIATAGLYTVWREHRRRSLPPGYG